MVIKRINRKILIIINSVVISLALTGCSNTDKDSKLKIRIAFFPNITHAQALIGKELGTFQKKMGKDVKVEYKIFNAGPGEIEAFLAGEVDIGYIGPTPAINGFAKSHGELQIISGSADGGMMLVSRKELKINSLKDLSGKKVSVPQFGNTQDLVLRFLLKQNRLKDVTKGGNVQIIQAENPDIKALLDKKQIDAALVPEPWGSRLVKEIGANIVLDSNQIEQFIDIPTTVIIANTDFLKKHKDMVEKFLEAHRDLTRFIMKNPEKSLEIINEQLAQITSKPLPADILYESMKRVRFTTEIKKESLQKTANLSFEWGYLKQKPDIKNLVNLEFISVR